MLYKIPILIFDTIIIIVCTNWIWCVPKSFHSQIGVASIRSWYSATVKGHTQETYECTGKSKDRRVWRGPYHPSMLPSIYAIAYARWTPSSCSTVALLLINIMLIYAQERLARIYCSDHRWHQQLHQTIVQSWPSHPCCIEYWAVSIYYSTVTCRKGPAKIYFSHDDDNNIIMNTEYSFYML